MRLKYVDLGRDRFGDLEQCGWTLMAFQSTFLFKFLIFDERYYRPIRLSRIQVLQHNRKTELFKIDLSDP